jgi:predicted DNA-binding ribbon-helix-helix protein
MQSQTPAKSRVQKRTIRIGERSTSITLESEFWQAIKEIAVVRKLSTDALITEIDTHREHINRSSVIRVFVLDFFQKETKELAKWRKILKR